PAAVGRRTLSTASASRTASAAMVAPAAAKSSSRTSDLSPAPGSTATSAPSAFRRLTVSGVAATRGSPSISTGTAIFMGSPTRSPLRQGPPARALGARSGEEIGHEAEDDGNRHDVPFHEPHDQAAG